MSRSGLSRPFVRGPYNYDVKEASDSDGVIEAWEPSLTQQSQREEADINVILQRFGVTGQLPVIDRPPTFGDFTEAPDFQTAQNMLIAARESFMKIAPEIRARFDHDPAKFVDFCSDEKNLDEMRKMGLAVQKPVEPAPAKPEAKPD